jgi:hypothetical protein
MLNLDWLTWLGSLFCPSSYFHLLFVTSHGGWLPFFYDLLYSHFVVHLTSLSTSPPFFPHPLPSLPYRLPYPLIIVVIIIVILCLVAIRLWL